MRYILAVLVLAGCATPITTLEHPETKQVVQCGGGMSGSVAGGALGYHIQKNNDQKCIHEYMMQGFVQK